MPAMLLPLLLLSISLVAPLPSPQDPNDDVEVLSSGPVRVGGDTSDYPDFADYGSSGFPSLGGFPSIFGRGFGGGRPRVRVLVIPLERGQETRGGETSSIGDILTSLFGRGPPTASPREEPVSGGDDECGPFCTLLSTLWDSHIKHVKDQVDSVRDRENEVDGEDFFGQGDEQFDTNNSTHTTRVLEDGSVVHINKTTIADTDQDGNTFFFHKSIVSTVREEVEEEEDAEESFEAEENSEAEEDSETVENFGAEEEEEEEGVDNGLIA